VLLVPASVVVLVVIYAIRLYSRQQSIVFRPRAESTNRSPADFRIPYRDVMLQCADGVAVHCWWVTGRLPRTIVYFHGSDGNLTYELPTLRFLAQLGANLLLVDYPGYGRSGGRCSERLCYQAGDAAWTYVREKQGVAAEDIVLFGQSLGTAVATYIASTRECGGLVFQSGFESVPAMAAELFPLIPSPILWAFARTRMNSLRRIPDCRCPVLVMHSPGDEHIPITQARRIYSRATGPKRFVELRGVHFSGEWRRQTAVLEAWQELIGGDVRAWEAA
jgi:pimeloyl-ACP methyl ester carboxylesterase